MKTLQDALNYLNPDDDAQWTGNGLPLVEAVNAIWPNQVTRKEITEAAPTFNREALRVAQADPERIVEDLREDQTQVVIADNIVTAESLPETPLETAGDEAGEAILLDLVPEADVKVLSQYDELLVLQEESEQRMNDLAAEIKDVEAKLATERHVHLRIITTRDRVKPRELAGQNIKAYLKRQHETRMGKAVKQQAILQMGNIGDIDPRSPMDKKLTSRRNVRPLMTRAV